MLSYLPRALSLFALASLTNFCLSLQALLHFRSHRALLGPRIIQFDRCI
jgi:hypothetical protein